VQRDQISISIVIATKGRIDSLARLLESLSRLNRRTEIDHEVIIANNAPDESVARDVDAVVKRFSEPDARPRRVVRVNRAGKAVATNSAILLAKGTIIAFLDDDVAVAPGWLEAVADFFQNHSFEAMQGTIVLSPESEQDPEIQRMYHRYRTICLFPPRPAVEEIETLTGANMAIRKDMFTKVGLFDPRLGPGQSGTSDDTELAERIIRASGRIGCAPKAVVYHEVDWNRLTEDYFRLRHEQQGRSRLIYKKTSLPSIGADLIRAMIGLLLHSALNNERKKYRAKGRYYHYRSMLREKIGPLFRGKRGESPSLTDPILYRPKELPLLDRENQ
jgi:GT2 family glycosyltransferase